jgi:hypothetical protein
MSQGSGEDAKSHTIQEFCDLEKFSVGYFHKLKRLGLAPRVINPVGRLMRITAEERRAWHERMYAAGQKTTAKKQSQRRSEASRRAGKAAAASPNFSRRRKVG